MAEIYYTGMNHRHYIYKETLNYSHQRGGSSTWDTKHRAGKNTWLKKFKFRHHDVEGSKLGNGKWVVADSYSLHAINQRKSLPPHLSCQKLFLQS